MTGSTDAIITALRIADVPEDIAQRAVDEIVASTGDTGELATTFNAGLADLHLQFERLEQRLTQLEVMIGRQDNALMLEVDKQSETLQRRMDDLATDNRRENMLTRWLAAFNFLVGLAILARLFGILHG